MAGKWKYNHRKRTTSPTQNTTNIKDASASKKTKTKEKSVTGKKDSATSTQSWDKRVIGTQTLPMFSEKIIIPTKFKKESEEKVNQNESITESVNYDNFEDILRHLGKNVIGSGNHIFIVKLLVALISNLPKEAVNEEYITNILTTSTISNSIHP